MTMGRAKETVKQDLLALDPEERAEVAEDALRSLAATDYGALSPAWESEIDRRLRAADQGQAEPIDGDEVFKELDAELRARRGKR